MIPLLCQLSYAAILKKQAIVCDHLILVAGAGFEPATFGL